MDVLPDGEIVRTNRESRILDFLEEEGRIPFTNANRWADVCGTANDNPDDNFMKGCDQGIIGGDDAKRILVLCTFCLNAYHPGCAGLCPTIRRYRDDWACPECVYVAEAALKFDHLTPAQALHAINASLHSDIGDEVQSEDVDAPLSEPSPKYKLEWLRWRMSIEIDFAGEENMVTQLVTKRGHKCKFLPKFHCDINWSENHWGKSKPCVRELCDGTWMAMCKAIWLSFGQGNIPEELAQRFARKVRETIGMYHAGIDGPFAAYCQKKFKYHRLPFFDAASLAQWGENSWATAKKNSTGIRKFSCRVQNICATSRTCDIKFMDGSVRISIPLDDLGRPADNALVRKV